MSLDVIFWISGILIGLSLIGVLCLIVTTIVILIRGFLG